MYLLEWIQAGVTVGMVCNNGAEFRVHYNHLVATVGYVTVTLFDWEK